MKKTIFSPRLISSQYPQIGKISSIKNLTNDNNSSTFLISAAQGKFVLKNFHDGSSIKKIESICILLSKWKKSCNVEEPVKNNSGIFVNKKNSFFLTKYIDGIFFNSSRSELLSLAKNLALFHKTISRYKINYRTNEKKYQLITKAEMKQIKQNISKKKILTKFDNKFLSEFLLLQNQNTQNLKLFNKIKKMNFKKQLIHFDLHPKNVIFKNSKMPFFIDFTTLKNGYPLEDAIFCAFRFSNYCDNLSCRQKSMKLFLSKYLEYYHVEKNSLEFASFFLMYRILSSLSFILKNHYFNNSTIWDKDFNKFISYLKISKNLNFD